jgi:hypothetical protein
MLECGVRAIPVTRANTALDVQNQDTAKLTVVLGWRVAERERRIIWRVTAGQ